MSARAAWRLEGLGFAEVYDYVGGKVDWRASDLPTEGKPRPPRLGDLVQRQVPTCAPEEPARVVSQRAPHGPCVVVNGAGVVLGMVDAEAAAKDPDRPVEDVMTEGPSTSRPDVRASEMTERLEGGERDFLLVTTASGRLVGIVDGDDVLRAAQEDRG